MKEPILKIPFDQLDRIYVTSDTHYSHTNICRGVSRWERSEDAEGNVLGTRDFDTLEEMNQRIVDNINSMVPKDGILFHLGDWSFGGHEKIPEFRNQILCENIHIITGNHDHHIERGKYQHLFASQHKYLELKVGSMIFVLCHFPFEYWNHMNRGGFHLHGHEHWNEIHKFGNGRRMDVGVDGNGLYPYKLTDVIELLKDREWIDTKFSHHT